MNELVYLNDEDYTRITRALYRYQNPFETYGMIELDQGARDNITKTIAKIDRAKDEGLLMSFDVKKVKARRVR